MIRITYTGPADQLQVDELIIPRGEPTEVDDAVFRRIENMPGVVKGDAPADNEED